MRRLPGGGVVAATVALGLLVVALLRLWQGDAYVDFSDGVYAATARELLGGRALYDEVAAAQPPLLYLYGAGALAIDDSVTALRWAVGLAAVVQAALVALAVRRLTGASVAAVVAGVASMLLPWTLREHGALVPETLATPLLLGAALAAASGTGRLPVVAGVLAALAVALKVAFLLPAVAVLLVAAARGRALLAALITGVLLAAVTLGGFGGAAWENLVTAQLESGRHGLGYVAELWVHAVWAEGALVLMALLAWRLRARGDDPALVRTLAALVAGAALLLLTLLKEGSFLQVVAVLEAPTLALGAAGLVWSYREGRVAVTALGAVCAAFMALQSVSLLVDPDDAPLMTPPGSGLDAGWLADEDAVRAGLGTACRAASAHPGPPWVAFVAGRPMPGHQPDIFILRSETHRAKAEAASGVAVCPRLPG